jgi:hypothetical protein
VPIDLSLDHVYFSEQKVLRRSMQEQALPFQHIRFCLCLQLLCMPLQLDSITVMDARRMLLWRRELRSPPRPVSSETFQPGSACCRALVRLNERSTTPPALRVPVDPIVAIYGLSEVPFLLFPSPRQRQLRVNKPSTQTLYPIFRID